MPPGGATKNENVEPGGFEAISRWLSPSTAVDTTGGYGPELVHPWTGCHPLGLGKLAWWETSSPRVGRTVGGIGN